MATSDCTTKTCTKCGQTYPATAEYFHRRKKNNSLRSACKPCHNAQGRKWVQSLSEEQRSARRKVCTELQRGYYKRHNDEINQRDRERNQQPERQVQRRTHRVVWYEANRDYVREYHRQYRKAKPEFRKAQSERRRSLKKQALGTHTAADIITLYEQSEDRCMYCGIRLFGEYHLDHIHPLSRGGTNWPENLAIACVRCNTSKNDRTLAEWQLLRNW